MRIKVLAIVGALALAACDAPQTSLQAKPGQTAQQAVDTVLQVRAISLVVGVACRNRGITLRDTNFQAAVARDVRNLTRQGYSLAELERANKRANQNDRLTKNAIRYLQARGVRKNDPASLCAYGRREMAAGTAVGRLLKKT